MAGKKRRMKASEWLAFFSWIILAILIAACDNGLRSSDFSTGFGDSLEPAVKVIPIIAGGICILWLILISRVFRRPKNAFMQWLLMLFPVLAFGAWTFRELPTPQNQFFDITGVELPSRTEGFESIHKEVLFSGSRHTFSFKCPPDQTTRLIDDLDWRGPYPWVDNKRSNSEHNPDIASWTEPEVFGMPSKGGWNYTLITDSKRERVFIELSRH